MKTLSIKSSLLICLLSALFVIGVIFIAATYAIDRTNIERHQDHKLRAIALRVPPKLKPADLRLINVKLIHGPDDYILQIWRDSQEVYRSYEDVALPRMSGDGFQNQQWRGGRWKVFVRQMGPYTIQAEQSLDARDAMASARAFQLITPLILLMLAVAVCIPLCVDYGLRSLRRISKELDTRHLERLTPLDRRQEPAELLPLVDGINTLLARLDDAAQDQRRFVADASHELRTPLAAFSVQVQVAERAGSDEERAAAFASLRQNITRTNRLVHQLLTASRLDDHATLTPGKDVRLNDTCRDVLVQLDPLAWQRGINMGIVRDDDAVVNGIEQEMAILIQNLVDNAIRYTPQNGQVDVSLEASPERVIVRVEDSGPGIPPLDQQRVFERFVRRHGHDSVGSGLGLAIVKQIASRHGAEVTLSASKALGGLSVAVTFETASARLAPAA